MKYLPVFFAFLTLSCATQRRCYEKFSMSPDTVKIVSVRDSVVYKDTTVFVYIPGEIVTDSVIIPCPPPPPAYVPDTARVETDFALAKAWFQYPAIRLYLEQKDKFLRLRLDSALRDSWHWRNEYLQVTQVLKEKYVPKFVRNLAGFGGFVAGVLILIFTYYTIRFFRRR